ncbi:MAG: VWA domain-containing protein [Candidatus Calescibacterium sp.]|nr:VWA domain-containing protein [Candidatus Calescibacterium sp.]MDW8132196.1 VWA domain-containing protein [Candidatus Calescibacterium sp.]
MVLIRPEKWGAIGEVELLIFMLDGSASMYETNTFDGRRKSDHLVNIVYDTLERLRASSRSNSFRASLVYFSDSVIVPKVDGIPYYSLEEAINEITDPVIKMAGGGTSIANALNETSKIIDEFNRDIGLPDEKHITVFLFTDGNENIKTTKDVINEALKIKSMGVTICCISLGNDCDEKLLVEISSVASLRQVKRMDLANMLDFLTKEHENYKLFLKGHVDGKISKSISEAIRSFMNILSETR